MPTCSSDRMTGYACHAEGMLVWATEFCGCHKLGVSVSQGLSSALVGGKGSALWRTGKQHGDQVEFIEQQREVVAGGGVMGRRKKQVPGWGSMCDGCSPRLRPAWLCSVGIFFSSCLIPPQRENRKERREGAERAQREVMSLSALSSSSLMALYFIFCA